MRAVAGMACSYVAWDSSAGLTLSLKGEGTIRSRMKP